jgi:hypothetical protein
MTKLPKEMEEIFEIFECNMTSCKDNAYTQICEDLNSSRIEQIAAEEAVNMMYQEALYFFIYCLKILINKGAKND